jgi:hypothetical protein
VLPVAIMRTLGLAAALVLSSGCASTVYRVDGDARTPGGAPRSACEEQSWLVVAPTRAEIAPEGRKVSQPHDGDGLYRVGADRPENVVDHAETLGPDPTFADRRARIDPLDTRSAVGLGLGLAGLVAIGVGTGLFVSAFGTETTVQPDGRRDEESVIDGTRAGLGGGLVGLGFALGISGLAVSPTHVERTRGNAARYIFLAPEDDPDKVDSMVARHNATVRRQCEARGL